MQTLEAFDREIAAKRARLEKDHAVAHALPTATIEWIGENGWDSKGAPRDPVTRTLALEPWIIHSSFRGAEHVAYKAPDSVAGDRGEHVSSKYRKEFVHKYLRALLDTYSPFVIDTRAIKGRYTSFVPESFDYKVHKNYADAEELARGCFVVRVDVGSGYRNADLEFYVRIQNVGPAKISFGLGDSFAYHSLRPVAAYDNVCTNAAVVRWHLPRTAELGAEYRFARPGADLNSHGQPSSYSLEWLFSSREIVESAIGVMS